MVSRRFNREFKIQAVRLVTERGVAVSQACRDLELAESVLRRWIRGPADAPGSAFPHTGQQRAELASHGVLTKRRTDGRAEREDFAPFDSVITNFDAFARPVTDAEPYPITTAQMHHNTAVDEAVARSAAEARLVRPAAILAPSELAPDQPPNRQMTEPKRIGLHGLGIMGHAFAKNLRAAGFEPFGYDPTPEARSAFVALGGAACARSAKVARAAELHLLSLLSSSALGAMAEALAAGGRPGPVAAECSTIDLEVKTAAAAVLSAAGMTLLDSPVSSPGVKRRSAIW